MFIREDILNSIMLDDILETELNKLRSDMEIVFVKNNENYFLAYGCGVEENYYTMACFNEKIKHEIKEKPFGTKLLGYVLYNQKDSFLDESMDIFGLKFYCLDKPLGKDDDIYDLEKTWYDVEDVTVKDNKFYIYLT